MARKRLGDLCLITSLAIALGCATRVCAQTAPNDQSSDKTDKGAITGRVVNENGEPIANVQVSVSGYSGQGRVATTDAEGRFQVTELTAVAYLVNVYAPGYVEKPRDPDIDPVGYYHIGDSVRLEMIKGGVITGTVARADGEPLVRIRVNAYLIRDSKGQMRRSSYATRSEQTDDRGVYRIYGLSPGTYVVSTDGGSASSYEVNPFATDVPTFAPSSRRDTATEVSVSSGEEVSGIDIRYNNDAGRTVSGSVTSANPADVERGFGISLVSVVNGSEQGRPDTYQPPNGHFMFSGVADGDYKITANSYLPGAGWSMSEAQQIKVKGADVAGIQLTVKPLASISGSVSLEDSKVSECQGKRRPALGEIVIGAYHNEKNAAAQPEFVWGMGGPTTPDARGAFTLQNLVAGQYRFITRSLAKYWYLKSVAWPSSTKAAQVNQPLDAARNWTTVKTSDKLSGLTITFASGAASLQGRIESAEGKMLPRAFVYLAPAESANREDVLRYFAALVAGDGSFDIGNVPPGRYWVVAKAAAASDANMLSKLRLPDETELRSKIFHEGESAKTSAELKPCQNVTDYRVGLRTIE
jgi:hypothetical protein